MKSKDKLLPVSELFTNFQGEATYCGQLQYFIRLSGCCVGKPYPKERHVLPKQPDKCTADCDVDIGHLPECEVSRYFAKKAQLLPIYTEECHTWSGKGFPCDTDYRVKERLSVKEILDRMPAGVEHICISGGEPFIHDLVPLVTEAQKMRKIVHVETSGTVPMHKAFPPDNLLIQSDFFGMAHPCQMHVWVTLSPKLGVLPEMIDRADEIKILVDEDFHPNQLPLSIVQHKNVFIQPINNERSIRADNLKLVMKWQQENPSWRISLQLHKAVEMITHERVL